MRTRPTLGVRGLRGTASGALGHCRAWERWEEACGHRAARRRPAVLPAAASGRARSMPHCRISHGPAAPANASVAGKDRGPGPRVDFVKP